MNIQWSEKAWRREEIFYWSDLREEFRMSEEKRDDTWVIKGKGLKFVKKEKLKYILLDVK